MIVKSSKLHKPDRLHISGKSISNSHKKSYTQSELENEIEELLDSSNDAIRAINSDFTIRRINRIFAEITGVNQNEVIGKKCWEIFPSSLCHTPHCRAWRVFNGEQEIKVEIERQRPNGTTIPCLVTTSPLTDNVGNTIGIIEQFRDITEHRQMKKQVNETENRYRALIELGTEAGEAIVMLQNINGKEGIQTFFNNQWPKIIGYTEKELLGTSFFTLVHPDDRQSSLERHRQKMGGKTVSGNYEMKLIRKNGIEIFVELTGAYTIYQGERANVMFIRDITERKQTEIKLALSEKQFQTLFENAPVGLWEMDNSGIKKFIDNLHSKGVKDLKEYFLNHPEETKNCTTKQRIIKVNKYAENIMEGNVAQIRKGISDLARKATVYQGVEDTEVFADFVCRLSKAQKKPSCEMPIRTMQGNIKYVLQQITIVPGHENNWSKVILADVDITERKQINDELLEYKNNLEQMVKTRTLQLHETNIKLKAEVKQRKVAEKHLGESLKSEKSYRRQLQNQMNERVEFMRAVIHELKTPITSMLISSDILARVVRSEKAQSLARNIQSGSVYMNKRLNELVYLSKGELKILHLNIEKLQIEHLIHDAIMSINPRIAEKKLFLELDLSNSMPVISGDKEKLMQLILNLLDNAIKYTPENGKITINASILEEYIIIQIKDTVVGIAPLKQRSLLKITSHNTPNSNQPVVWVGLALCKTIVELHGGKIWAQSEVGHGSIFYFTLPMNIKRNNKVIVSNKQRKTSDENNGN